MELKSKHISIETTNLCPAHCTICPREQLTQKLGIMDFDLFKKIINDATQYDIASVDTCGFGEPFTDKLFFKRCQYIREKLPKAKIFVSSNCFLMTPDIYDDVIKYTDILKISVYGVTKNTYEKAHQGSLKFEKTYSNILGFLEKIKGLKKRPHTIGLITVTDINRHEMNNWIKFWKPKLDEVYAWLPHNYSGARNYRTIDYTKQESCGRQLYGPPFIHVDGLVSMCCFDFNKKLIIGDMKTQTLYEIFHSEAYQKLKRAHQTKNFKGYLCYNCCQTNHDSSALLYATNKEREVGKINVNLRDLKPEKRSR